MSAIDAVFFIAILIMSIVVHEVAHGFVALRYGDKTALYAGRLTLNPLKHLDLFGSIILPILLFFSVGFVFGWAKPVPYNPNNLSDRKWGTFFVAAAGVLANFAIALIFGLIMRFSGGLGFGQSFYFIMSTIVLINIALGVFNLVPIPPLDGSKILFSLLPESTYRFQMELQRYSLILLLLFIVFFIDVLYPILTLLYKAFTGFAL